MELFRGLNESGVTLVLVTHESEVASHSRRVVTIRDGRIQ
jgi:putative ABC transport system ATP-binding protein